MRERETDRLTINLEFSSKKFPIKEKTNLKKKKKDNKTTRDVMKKIRMRLLEFFFRRQKRKTERKKERKKEKKKERKEYERDRETERDDRETERQRDRDRKTERERLTETERD